MRKVAQVILHGRHLCAHGALLDRTLSLIHISAMKKNGEYQVGLTNLGRTGPDSALALSFIVYNPITNGMYTGLSLIHISWSVRPPAAAWGWRPVRWQ